MPKDRKTGIWVDEVQPCVPNQRWPWNRVAHLMCGPNDDINELHRFASRLGLKRRWFQPRHTLPHYDLTEGKRQQAIRLGAKIATRQDLVELAYLWRAFRKVKPK